VGAGAAAHRPALLTGVLAPVLILLILAGLPYTLDAAMRALPSGSTGPVAPRRSCSGHRGGGGGADRAGLVAVRDAADEGQRSLCQCKFKLVEAFLFRRLCTC